MLHRSILFRNAKRVVCRKYGNDMGTLCADARSIQQQRLCAVFVFLE